MVHSLSDTFRCTSVVLRRNSGESPDISIFAVRIINCSTTTGRQFSDGDDNNSDSRASLQMHCRRERKKQQVYCCAASVHADGVRCFLSNAQHNHNNKSVRIPSYRQYRYVPRYTVNLFDGHNTNTNTISVSGRGTEWREVERHRPRMPVRFPSFFFFFQ